MRYLSIIILVIFLWSCGSDGEEISNKEPKVEIISSEKELMFMENGGTTTIQFTSNVPWKATSNQSWCDVSPSSGEIGTNALNITVTANTEYEERNAVVYIEYANLRKSIIVKQKQKDAIVLSSSKIEMNVKGGDIQIDVKSNISFEYEIEESAKAWLTPKATSRNLTTSTLHFIVSENEDTEKRQGKIIFRNGAISENIEVYQDGAIPTLILTQNEYIVADAGEEIKIELKSNVAYEMTLPNVDWITETQTRAMYTDTHYFVIAPNNNYDSREAYILFFNKENGISEKVIISQKQKDAIILANSEYTIGFEGGKLDFEVSTNMDFEVQTSVDWITQLPATRGLKTERLLFNIADNSGSDVREGKIILKNGDLKQEIKVIQQKMVIGEAIDLGLSVKWASHNLGASSPEEYGGLYGLGDPTGTHTEIPGDNNNSKEVWEYYGGSIPDGIVSGTSLDIARVKWGGDWRLPTYYDLVDLRNKCSWEWTACNGIDGYKVTGPNGNSIFLPASGFRLGTKIEMRGVEGNYWSGRIYGEASFLKFYSYNRNLVGTLFRYKGFSVRPVTK